MLKRLGWNTSEESAWFSLFSPLGLAGTGLGTCVHMSLWLLWLFLPSRQPNPLMSTLCVPLGFSGCLQVVRPWPRKGASHRGGQIRELGRQHVQDHKVEEEPQVALKGNLDQSSTACCLLRLT